MAVLTKDALLAAAGARSTLEMKTIDVPELGGSVIVRGMTGRERDAWERSLIQERRGARRVSIDTENIRARLACRCLVNEQGERLFDDGDAEILGNLSAAILGRIYDAAQKLNGLSNEDIDELKKSSEAAAGSDSPSPSPSASAE